MKMPSLNVQIFFGALFGVLIGLYFQQQNADSALVQGGLYASGLIGTLFIDLLKMILVPLVFCSIAVGIANLRQHSQIHRVWVTALLFFIGSMVLAIAVAMIASNYFKPGVGMQIAMFAGAMENFQAQQMGLPEFFAHFLHGLFVNPFTALAQSNVIAVVVFALILGIALVVGGERYQHLLRLLQEGLELTMLVVNWIMRLAPFGIAALLIKLISTQDVSVLNSLASFVALVVGTTLFHGLVILPLVLYLFTKKHRSGFYAVLKKRSLPLLRPVLVRQRCPSPCVAQHSTCT